MIRAFPHRHIASVTVRTGTCASLKEQNLRLVVEKYGSANDLLKTMRGKYFSKKTLVCLQRICFADKQCSQTR